MSLPFFRRSAAQQLYPTQLAYAYAPERRVWDTDWAQWQDEEIYQVAMRDPVFALAARHRKHLVAGPVWTIEAASEDERDQRAAELIERLLDHLCGFAASRFNLANAIFVGTQLALVEGTRKHLALAGGARRPWWVPTALADVGKNRLLQRAGRTADGAVVTRWYLSSLRRPGTWDEITAATPIVRHSYDATEDTLGYGRGLLESAYTNVYARGVLKKKGLQGADRWAQGILVAKVGDRPGSAARTRAQIAETIRDNLKKSTSEHIHVIDQADSLEVVTGGAEGHQIVTELYDRLGVELVRLILAANLPTGGDAKGSYAQAVTEADSTMVGVRFDRESLAETLTRDLLGIVWRLNAANLHAVGLGEANRPRLKIAQEDTPDAEREARIVEVALRAGVALREDEVYQRLGYTPPKEGEPTLRAPTPAAPGPPAPTFAVQHFAADDERLERFAARAEAAEAAVARLRAEEDEERDDEVERLAADVARLRAGGEASRAGAAADAEERYRAAWRAEVEAFRAQDREQRREREQAEARAAAEPAKEAEVTKAEAAELFRAALGETVGTLRAEFARDREQMRVELAELRARVAVPPPAAPPAAPLAGVQFHVGRAEIAPATGDLKVFTQDLEGTRLELSESDRRLQAETTMALREVGEALGRFAARPEPASAAPQVNVSVTPRIEAELKLGPRVTEITLPDGKKARSETRDALEAA